MNIDWTLLRQQKLDLLAVIGLAESGWDIITPSQTSSLTGILHLIDGIQDEAVEQRKYDQE